MDEIIVRPKYSRQTSTQRKRRREQPDNDLLSTAFAAKLLVVVVFLSVFALCKAANTTTTNFLISKVKVIATSNYDVNKYLINIASVMGIKAPLAQNIDKEANQNSKEKGDIQSTALENSDKQNNESSTAKPADNNAITTGITVDVDQTQTLEDTEIKAIADKFSFITPIKGSVASTFGTRTDPLSGESQFHSGLDIEANMGTSIKAALGGEVIEVGSNPEYNQYVKIQHNDGISTIYAHCSLLIAKQGDKVNQGDVIAKVGDSEGLPGSYLHFEVWKDNKAVDPEKLLNYLNQ